MAILVGLLGGPSAALAQTPWRTSYFPYLIGNPTDGLMLIARWQRVQDAPYFLEKGEGEGEDKINPVTFRGALSTESGAGTLGSRFARVEFRAPALVSGWRFHAIGSAERTGTLGYYGPGGGFVDEPANRPEGANAEFFRVHRNRAFAQVEVTREIAGPLRFAVAARLDHTRLSPFSDSTLYLEHFGRRPLSRTDFVIRPALVVDTRDREFVPANGILFETGLGFGTAGSYVAGYVHARGYVSVRDGTVIAARALYRDLGRDAPIAARLYVQGWERETAPSGPTGHRSFPTGAIATARFGLASLDLRHDLLNAGDFGAVTALGFLDYGYGRDSGSGEGSAFGGGVGVAVRILRSAILTINFAGGPNGFNFSMGNGWAF